MTTLGKILVVANLLFSLATAGLILVVYQTRTNWQGGFEKVRNALTVAQADRDTYMRQVEDERKKGEDEVRSRETRITALQANLTRTEGERDKLRDDLTNLNAIANASKGNNNALTSQLQSNKTEIANLQGQVAQRDQRILAMEAQVKSDRDLRVAAEINLKGLQERNELLLKEMETLAKRPSGRGYGGTGAAAAPPEGVDGIILDTDRSSGLVTLSIGSDAGLGAGQRLYVYRLKPKPEYVGKIRILRVEPDKAVARPDGRLETGAGPIQKGDTVATSIPSVRG